MKNRRERVQVIIDLISNGCISSQEELSKKLQARGYSVTQATLSRDLKLLKTSKVATDMGGYVYILPDEDKVKNKMISTGQTSVNVASHGIGFISLEFSGNMAVIKTRNGYASGIAFDIDLLACPEILGSIAGANTIFLVLAEGVDHETVREKLGRILPLDNSYYRF